MAISIIVADDHPLTRSGLAGFIRENGAYALHGEAEDGVRAWELIRERTPDIALLDIRMPGEDGVAVTRRIRASGLRTRVIMLTSYDARSYVMASLMAGASGFVLKTSAIRELSTAIDRVLAGGIYLDPNAGDALRERETAPEALTAREREVLLLISRGFSIKDVSGKLSITERTVQAHLTSIYDKFQCRSKGEALLVGLKYGVFTVDELLQSSALDAPRP